MLTIDIRLSGLPNPDPFAIKIVQIWPHYRTWTKKKEDGSVDWERKERTRVACGNASAERDSESATNICSNTTRGRERAPPPARLTQSCKHGFAGELIKYILQCRDYALDSIIYHAWSKTGNHRIKAYASPFCSSPFTSLAALRPCLASPHNAWSLFLGRISSSSSSRLRSRSLPGANFDRSRIREP